MAKSLPKAQNQLHRMHLVMRYKPLCGKAMDMRYTAIMPGVLLIVFAMESAPSFSDEIKTSLEARATISRKIILSEECAANSRILSWRALGLNQAGDDRSSDNRSDDIWKLGNTRKFGITADVKAK